jgi:hypothetical protein
MTRRVAGQNSKIIELVCTGLFLVSVTTDNCLQKEVNAKVYSEIFYLLCLGVSDFIVSVHGSKNRPVFGKRPQGALKCRAFREVGYAFNL